MPKEHGGDPIISDDDRLDPVEFHQELGDERVHSLEDLTAVLSPFEESPRYSRQNMSNADLETYLEHDENLHWGNPHYVYEDLVSKAHLELHYSPWLNEDKNILLEGTVSYDQKFQSQLSHNEYTNIENLPDPVEPVSDEDHLYWVSVPTDSSSPKRLFVVLDTLLKMNGNIPE